MIEFDKVKEVSVGGKQVSEIWQGDKKIWSKLPYKRELESANFTGTNEKFLFGQMPIDTLSQDVSMEWKMAPYNITTKGIYFINYGNPFFVVVYKSSSYHIYCNNYIKQNFSYPPSKIIEGYMDYEKIILNKAIYQNTKIANLNYSSKNISIMIEAGGFTFFYLKVYFKGVLSYDIIPVVDNNNNICLFDKISKKLFYK